jgi:hypothetical protein
VIKATLIIIQNQADHEAAKALVGKLMQSNEAADRARRLVLSANRITVLNSRTTDVFLN